MYMYIFLIKVHVFFYISDLVRIYKKYMYKEESGDISFPSSISQSLHY